MAMKDKQGASAHDLERADGERVRRPHRRAVLLSCCALLLVGRHLSGTAGPFRFFTREGRDGSLDGYLNGINRVGELGRKCDAAKNLDVEAVFLSIPDSESVRRVSHEFSSASHVAGTENDRLFSLRLKREWEELLGVPVTSPDENVFESGSEESQAALMGRKARPGWSWRAWFPKPSHKARVYVDTYFPLLNSPVSNSLTLTSPNSSTPYFVAKLLEDEVPEDPTSGTGRLEVPAFHGMSKNGTARGALVYAGSGSREDFAALKAGGIDCTDKIVIVNYGTLFRGSKVTNAADAGAIGVLIYTDPSEDGDMTEANGHLPYPYGPARHPSSLQRGTVQAISTYTGDPLTPFFPAYKNSTHRLSQDDPNLNMPSIPSLPISYEDAVPLLRSLNGKGVEFVKGGLGGKGVEYWTGPGEDTVEMVNHVEYKISPIWNTMAVIPGHIEDEVVLLGNHNDAWVFGSSDPVSGSASVQEIVRALGVLLKHGWKPLRTLVLASWDAEEYGMVGSTEFGEDFATYIQNHVVAYLNVDVSFTGTSFSVDATPSLADLFKNASRAVQDPDDPSQTLLDRMAANTKDEGGAHHQEKDGLVGALGSGSDWPVFIQHLGIASSNIEFMSRKGDPAYHYHSIYDSSYWQDHFGDVNYTRHAAVAKVLGLAALRLVDSPILPLNVTSYTSALSVYVRKVQRALNETALPGWESFDLASLQAGVDQLDLAARNMVAEIELATHELSTFQSAPSRLVNPMKRLRLLRQVRSINTRLQRFESGFSDPGGLPGRPWFRSLTMAPSRYSGYGATTFPGLTEAITLDHDLQQAAVEVKRLLDAFERVKQGLVSDCI